MAFDPAPSTWMASWSEDGTDITVPIATFSEMTAAEADGTTGDIRKVLFAMCEHLADTWYATASADRPSKMTIGRARSTNEATGIQTITYSFRFDVEVSSQEVDDE